MTPVPSASEVRDRLLRATAALDAAGVPYAVVGRQAVAVWIARIDKTAVRDSDDAQILLRRADFPAANLALEAAGFVYRHSVGFDFFVDGEDGKVLEAIHLLFANESIRKDYSQTALDVVPYELAPPFRMLPFAQLVQMLLSSFRIDDRLDVRNLIDVGLIDDAFLNQLPAELALRLRGILNSPDD
jgi:hypothetical protein